MRVYSTLAASGPVQLYAVYTSLWRNMYTCLSTVLSDIKHDKDYYLRYTCIYTSDILLGFVPQGSLPRVVNTLYVNTVLVRKKKRINKGRGL